MDLAHRRFFAVAGVILVACVLMIALSGNAKPSTCVAYGYGGPTTVKVAGHTLTHLHQEAC
jgi:hypothetical protein